MWFDCTKTARKKLRLAYQHLSNIPYIQVLSVSMDIGSNVKVFIDDNSINGNYTVDKELYIKPYIPYLNASIINLCVR